MIFNKMIFLYHEPHGDLKRVGGKIFYIDSTASGATYIFYDSEGNVITDIQVGDTPYAYSVTDTGNKDKYYVFNDALATSKRWTYQQDGSWVYDLLNTGTAIGTGKTNTATVMAADNGKYVTELTGGDTIWSYINSIRTSLAGGCNDWFVPSKDEGEALRTATDREGEALVSWFSNNVIWYSSQRIASESYKFDYTTSWNSAWKDAALNVFGVRAF